MNEERKCHFSFKHPPRKKAFALHQAMQDGGYLLPMSPTSSQHDDQLNALLDRFDKTEKQPGSARLLIQMMSVKVTVSPKAVDFKAVSAVVGAGERT